MQSLLDRFDQFAGIKTQSSRLRWLERTAFFFLVLMILAAPHSIAATQTAWLAGMFAWAIRFCFKPRPQLIRTPLDTALWAFFIWTVLSALFSYAPDISIDKLRNAALFLIFYFIINLVRTRRAGIFLAFALIFSCMANVVWMPVERLVGRGVEIRAVKPENPLIRHLVGVGDTLLEANKRKIRTPEDLVKALEENETVRLKAHRPDYNFEVAIKRSDLLPGATAQEKLGITDWRPSRNWRSSGFYSFYVTYAEVLQLIGALAFGLFVALLTRRNSRIENQFAAATGPAQSNNLKRNFNFRAILLAACLAGISFALLLTATRASQAAFFVAAFVIVWLGARRRMLLLLGAVVLPLAIGALVYLQHSRNVGFFDTKDNSILWRRTVYREGFELATANLRHASVGVGMDSIKRYAKDWRLFDDGRLPMGHFHSTPLQLAVERGFPALFLWFWILWIYGKLLLKYLKSEIQNRISPDWRRKGIVLGCFGGLVGFFTSGLVHYNYGDAIVAMMFFILMGLSVRIAEGGEQ